MAVNKLNATSGGELIPYAKSSTPVFSVVTGSNIRGYVDIDTSTTSTSKYYALRTSNTLALPGCLIGGTDISVRYSATSQSSAGFTSVPFKPTATTNSMVYSPNFPSNAGSGTLPSATAMISCFTDGTYIYNISATATIQRALLSAIPGTSGIWSASSTGLTSVVDGCYEATAATNKYVIVGLGTQIGSSANGTSWTLTLNAAGNDLYCVASSPTATAKYVAAGANGILYSSPDGTTWTSRTSNAGTDSITSMAWANGKYVGGTTGGKVIYSTDGITWTAVTPLLNSAIGMHYSTWHGKWFTVDIGTRIVWSSSDGITWASTGWDLLGVQGGPGARQNTKRIFSSGAMLIFLGMGVSGAATSSTYMLGNNFYTNKAGTSSGTTSTNYSTAGFVAPNGTGFYLCGDATLTDNTRRYTWPTLNANIVYQLFEAQDFTTIGA